MVCKFTGNLLSLNKPIKMTELFRSAFNYLGGGGAGGGERGSEFVGHVVELGERMKLKIKKVIAEGGYGFVFVAQDIDTGEEYALKRQVVPSENVKSIKQEISFLKQLKGHPHIIEFIGAVGVPSSVGSAEFIIVTELITGGELVDIVNTQRLTPKQVLRIFHETCLAVAHMHSMNPPIIHRDLKVENLLLTSDCRIKLCDFGSATTHQNHPNHTWSATQRGLAEDEIQRNTTPMYRSPEMIDLYSNNPVNEKADIWALGCLLYKLCYQEHPFEDSAKLRILNANYHIPPNDTVYKPFHNIIRSCLTIEPHNRPSADSIIAQLFSIADGLGENLDLPHSEPLLVSVPNEVQTQESQTHSNTTEHDYSMGAAFHSTSHQAHKFFGIMRGGAENLFKNIKDTSNKVLSSVQGSRQKSLDISYITSRILVMSFPHEVISQPHQNSLDEVGVYLEETHPSQYLVFNLSGEEYDVTKLNGQVVDYEWPYKLVPPLESLVELCRQMDSWLRADSKNVLVVHCKDGIHPTVVVIAAYILFLQSFLSPQAALRMFSGRRLPEGEGIQTSASERRYLNYITQLVSSKPYKPHSHSINVLMLRLSSVPLYNESRTGCKPFLEIFIGGERVYTSCSKENMDKIRDFTIEDGMIEIPIEMSVQGNILIVVHHIKAVPVKSTAMGMSAVKMLQFQFHTGFVPPNTSTLTLHRNELDGSAARRIEKFPNPFKVMLDLQVDTATRKEIDVVWQQLPHQLTHPLACFSTAQEQEEVLSLFGGSNPTAHTVTSKTTPIVPDEGYSQLMDSNPGDVTTGNLIGGTPPGGGIQYAPYRDTIENESSSSSSSSSESSSSDTEKEENQFDPFKSQSEKEVPQQPPHQTPGGGFEEFFSNPIAGIEEVNLLEFSTEEEEVTSQEQKGYTSFVNTETMSQSGTSAPSFDLFASWENHSKPVSTSSTVPVSKTSNTGFDPFGTTTGSDLFELMGSSPLKPTSTTSQPGLSTTQTTRPKMHPSSSGHPGWASFAHTNTSSGNVGFKENPSVSFKTHDPFSEIWSEASSKASPQLDKKSNPTKSSDPFSRLGDFRSNQTTHNPTMTSRPTYQMQGNIGPMGTSGLKLGSNNQGSRSPSPSHSSKVWGDSRPKYGTSGLKAGYNNQGSRSPSPSHSSKVWGDRQPKSKYGPVPNISKSHFDELLDPGLFTKKEDEGPVPLKEMKRKNEIEKSVDPERAKVAAWAEGKEHNIRALLSSLHTILWEEETRWKPIGIHQLVEADTVGKYFRRACLSVHPDKIQGSEHENLARAIFDELNDAYELFEKSGSKSLYQL